MPHEKFSYGIYKLMTKPSHIQNVDGAVRGAGLRILPIAELVRIANLPVSVSGSFDYLCSFYSCTPTPQRPSMAHTRFLTCRVGVNADLQLEVARAHTRPSL